MRECLWKQWAAKEKKLAKVKAVMAFILICSNAGMIMLGGCGDNKEDERVSQAVKVKVTTVSREEVTMPVRTSGVLVSSAEMKLSFKTAGIIRNIYVKEGDDVTAGDVLAELDLSEIEAVLLQAESAWRKAKRDMDRVENLYADSVATLEQLQNTKTALEVASSNLRKARFNMKHSRITAPSRGRVLKRLAEENELVAAGAPIFIFGSRGEGWKVRVGVSDRDMVAITPGDSATVRFDAWEGIDFSANVSKVSQYTDPHTGTYEVELRLKSDGRRLASGFTAKVFIFPSRRIYSFVFPVSALVEADGSSGYIYQFDRGKKIALRIPVDIVAIDGDKVAGRADIDEPAVIVTEGAAYLTDGMSVEVVE
jgi:multidrug efflux system membrane fusion protein